VRKKRIEEHTENMPHAARAAFKEGKHIFRNVQEGQWSYEALSMRQQAFLDGFNDDSLYSEMIKANKAYGHGEGAEQSLTLQQRLEIELTGWALRK
jgi:hypothetical protein